MTGIERVAHDKDSAHRAACEIYDFAKNLILAGKKVCFRAKEQEDDRSIRQNKFYWGVVLKEISEQVRLDGQRFTAEAWHYHFKQRFLGYEFKTIQLPGRKSKSTIRELRSTTELSVKQFTDYLDQIQAQAINDMGVRFSAPSWQEWHG